MKQVLILGASSDVAMSLARKYASEGYDILLAAREPEKLEDDASDLRLRFQKDVTLLTFDVLDISAHDSFVDELPRLPEVVISVIGLMTDQTEAETNAKAAQLMMRSNYEGPSLILARFAEKFRARGAGTLIGISSVSGERGRRKNYIYGSAKAGFTTFLSGLRASLHGSGVTVITVKPGWIRTSKLLEVQETPGLLTASPDEVADAIFKAQSKGREVIYTYSIWRLIMMIIKFLPEWLFKRLSF
jgi:short-subunit dehydrogenase